MSNNKERTDSFEFSRQREIDQRDRDPNREEGLDSKGKS